MSEGKQNNDTPVTVHGRRTSRPHNLGSDLAAGTSHHTASTLVCESPQRQSNVAMGLFNCYLMGTAQVG